MSCTETMEGPLAFKHDLIKAASQIHLANEDDFSTYFLQSIDILAESVRSITDNDQSADSLASDLERAYGRILEESINQVDNPSDDVLEIVFGAIAPPESVIDSLISGAVIQPPAKKFEIPLLPAHLTFTSLSTSQPLSLPSLEKLCSKLPRHEDCTNKLNNQLFWKSTNQDLMTVLDGKTNATSIVKFDMSIDQKTSDFILSSLFPDSIGGINIDYEKLNFTKRHTENSNGSTSCVKSEWLKLVIWDGGLTNTWNLDSNKKPPTFEKPLMPMSSDSFDLDLVTETEHNENIALMSELKLDKAIEQLKDDKMYSEVFERFEATPESDYSGFHIRKLDDWCEDSSTSHSPCPSPRDRKSLSARQPAHGLLTPVSAEKKVKVIKEPSSVPCVRKRRYKRQRNPYIDDECRVSGFGYGSDEEVSDYEDDGFVVPDDYVDSGDESEVDKIDEIEESEPELEVGTSADKDSRNDASESQTAGPPRKRLKKKAQQPCSPSCSELDNEIDEIESFSSVSFFSEAKMSSQSSDDTFFKPQIRRKRKFIIDDDDEESNGNNGENSFKPKQPVKKNQKQALFPPINNPWIDHNTKSSKVARGQGQKSDRCRNLENLVKYILNVNTDIDILGDGSGTKVKVFERPIFTESDSQDVYRDEGNIASIIDAVTDQTTTTDELCSKQIGPSSPIDDEIHKVLNTMSQELYIKSGLDAREYILENPGLLVPDDSRKVTQFTVNMLSKDAYAESNKMLIPVPDMPKYLIDDSIDTAGIISQLQIRKKSGISSLELDLQWYYDQKVSYDFAIQRQEYEVTDNNEALVSYVRNMSNNVLPEVKLDLTSDDSRPADSDDQPIEPFNIDPATFFNIYDGIEKHEDCVSQNENRNAEVGKSTGISSAHPDAVILNEEESGSIESSTSNPISENKSETAAVFSQGIKSKRSEFLQTNPVLSAQTTGVVASNPGLGDLIDFDFTEFSAKKSIDDFMQLRGYKTAIDADVRLEPSNEKVEIAAEQTKTSQQEPSITAPASLEQTTSSVVARIPERINNSITEFTVIASSRLIQQRDIVCELDRNSVNLLERDFSYLSAYHTANVAILEADIIIDERSCIVCYPISYLSQQIDPHAPEGNGLRSLGSAQLLDVLSRLGSRYEYITIVLEGYSKSVGVSTGMQRIGESSLKTYPFTPPHQEGLCELQQIIPSIATYFDVKINILYSMSPSESAWIIRKSCEIAVRRVEHLTAGDVTGDIESENGNKSRYSRQCALGWKNKEQWLDRSWMNSELTTHEKFLTIFVNPFISQIILEQVSLKSFMILSTTEFEQLLTGWLSPKQLIQLWNLLHDRQVGLTGVI